MNLDRLFMLGEPGLFVVSQDKSQFADLVLQLNSLFPKAIVRKIRGIKSRTTSEFFVEIAAAMQFPYYFGENWPAFNEVITDLDWLEGNAYLLMISEADQLMIKESGEDFRILMKILMRATKEWLTPNAYIPRNRQPTPFHTLFQVDVASLDEFSQRMERAGADFELL